MNANVAVGYAVIIVILGGLVMGCAENRNLLRHDILFTPQGTERDRPALDLYERLCNESVEGRKRLIRELVEIVTGSGAYSRVAALGGLLFFLDEYAEYYNPEVVKAIAESCIRIADNMHEYTIFIDTLMAPDWQARWWLQNLLDVRVVAYGENMATDLPYKRGTLPPKWRARDGGVFVNGRPVARYQWTYESNPEGDTEIPKMVIDWRKVFLERPDGKPVPEEEIAGDYEIVTRLTVIGPEGTEVVLEKKVILPLVWFKDYMWDKLSDCPLEEGTRPVNPPSR
jgi:hypothetical protein